MPSRRVRRRIGRRRDSGYMLLVLMLAVAVLTITMLGVARNYRRSILRDREVEMIHRGVQYERAIRIYYRKFGRYPISIEQLENTNKIRFLRKRYKDPMSPDGLWQLAHVTDIKLTGPGLTGLTAAAGNTGTPVANPNQANAGNLSSAAVAAEAAQTAADNSNTGMGTSNTAGQTATDTNPGTPGIQTTQGASPGGPADASGTSGNGAGPVLGGGPVLGVISKSKVEGIHSFNDKSKYNEWYFIYDPSQDKGQQLNGPYNPNLTLGMTANVTGTSGGQAGTPANPAAPTNTSPMSPANTMPSTTPTP